MDEPVTGVIWKFAVLCISGTLLVMALWELGALAFEWVSRMFR